MANNRVRNIYTSNATVVVPPGVTSIRTIAERPMNVSFDFGSADGTGYRVQASNNQNWQMIAPDGNLYAWGTGSSGELGIGTGAACSSPTVVPNTFRPLELNGGGGVSLCLALDGTLWAAGANASGQLGIGTTASAASYTAVLIPRVSKMFGQPKPLFGDQVVRTATRTFHALDSAGNLWGWGYNGNGQVGANVVGTLNVSSPALVIGFTAGQINRVTNEMSGGTTFFMQPDGTTFASGMNTYGQLGANISPLTSLAVSQPVAVAGTTKFSQIFGTDGNQVFALDTTGGLWGWGQNTQGQLGTNDVASRSSPVAIASAFKFSKVNLASSGWFGLTTTGFLYGCGYNGNYNFGLGTNINLSTPTLLAGGMQVSNFWSNANYCFAQRASDGVVFAWGANAAGQLGLNNTVSPQSTPVQVAGITGCTRIQLTPNASWATLANGQLWAAGNNTGGLLGIGSVLSTVPTFAQVGNGLLVQAFGLNSNSEAMLLDTQGRLYAWGANSYGGVGDGTQVSRSTPTLVAGLRLPDLRQPQPEIRDIAVTPGTSIPLVFAGLNYLAGQAIGMNATKVTLEFFQ